LRGKVEKRRKMGRGKSLHSLMREKLLKMGVLGLGGKRGVIPLSSPYLHHGKKKESIHCPLVRNQAEKEIKKKKKTQSSPTKGRMFPTSKWERRGTKKKTFLQKKKREDLQHSHTGMQSRREKGKGRIISPPRGKKRRKYQFIKREIPRTGGHPGAIRKEEKKRRDSNNRVPQPKRGDRDKSTEQYNREKEHYSEERKKAQKGGESWTACQ